MDPHERKEKSFPRDLEIRKVDYPSPISRVSDLIFGEIFGKL